MVSNSFVPPRPGPTHRPADYPRIPRMLGQEGNALFKVCVAANGTKNEIALIQSSGSDLLDRAARGYLEDDVTYQAALREGAPVEYCRNEVVVWRLPAEEGAAERQAPLNRISLTDYPAESIENNEQGRVVVNICVGADGNVDEVRLLESSGFARLDSATIAKVLADYRYSPMMENGVAVRSCYDQPVTWALQ